MTKSLTRVGFLLLVFLSMTVLVWVLTYPSGGDPKKHQVRALEVGLYPMDPNAAMETMVGDRGADKLVIGKKKAELQKRFGYLRSLTDASPYMKSCCLESPWQERDVL